MLGSLIRSCYYSSAKRDSAAVYRGKGHTLELVQCQGETCLTECRSHRDLFWVVFPCQCKAFLVPRASTPQPMPTKWFTVPPAATPSPFTPAISITCYIQAVNSLDLTSLLTIMQTCFCVSLFFSSAHQGHLGLWLQGAVLLHTSQTGTLPLLPPWSHMLPAVSTLSPFPKPRCLPWTYHCPQRDAGTGRWGAQCVSEAAADAMPSPTGLSQLQEKADQSERIHQRASRTSKEFGSLP